MTLLDPQEFLDNGRIGLYQSDLFISAVNPKRLQGRARSTSPDHRPPRQPVL